MFKRVLVTGGAGFIGSHTVDTLLNSGYEVKVLDSLDPQVHGPERKRPAYLNPNAEFIEGNVLDESAVAKAVAGVDAVIHDAALVGVGQSQYDPARYVESNTLGTIRLLENIIKKHRHVERFLVASSMSCYGEGMYRRPSDGALLEIGLRHDADLAAGRFEAIDPTTGETLEPAQTPESKPLNCTSIYALSKKDQEEYSLIYGATHGLATTACRYFNVYGPRQSLSNPYTGVAAIFSSRLKNNNPPIIYEDGGQARDFINVKDLAAAKVFLLERPDAAGQVYNLCTGKKTSVLQVAQILAKLLDKESIQPNITKNFRSGDIRHCIGDPSKLAALGFTAKIDFESGMRELVEWAAKEEAIDKVDQAHSELIAHGLLKSS